MDHPHATVMNDLSTHKEVVKDLYRYLNVNVYNLMLLPLVSKRGSHLTSVLCLFNRFKITTKTDESQAKKTLKEPINFSLHDTPLSSPLFLSILQALEVTNKLKREQDFQREEKSRVLSLVDSILRYPSMKRFQETVEQEFAKLFDCERANFILVNRNSKELYRVVYDKEIAEFKMKIFDFDAGVAGYVAFSAQTLFIDAVEEDIRYIKEIDDPQVGTTKAHQIVAAPVFCSNDKFDTSLNSMASIPRAVISLINKHDPNGFNQSVRINNDSPFLLGRRQA